MKYEIDINDDLVDELVATQLKDLLEGDYSDLLLQEDKDYYTKLLLATKIVYEHFKVPSAE